jgi:hypothetical protein
MSTTHTYDPQKCLLILGAAAVSGFADGTFVTVEQDEDSWTTRTGADGEVTRTRMAARTATMSLTLMATAVFNAILTGLHATDVIFPVLIKEGANIIAAGEAWVQKPPAFERGVEAADAEWTIRIAKWNPVFGGNPG